MAASKKKSTKAPKKSARKATAKKRGAKKAKKKAEPPGKGPQSGKSTGGAPPFATKNGTSTNVDANAPIPTSAPVDQGGPGWDIDQTEVPRGGTVTRADPSGPNSGGGGLGNGGNARPFKNLR